MSLTYDLTKIENWKTVCQRIVYRDDTGYGLRKGDETLHPVTSALISYTMCVGIGSIKDEAAAREFYARVSIYEALFGPAIRICADENSKAEPVRITLQDVIDHIGLSTNAGRESESAWLKRVVSGEMADRKRETPDLNVARRARTRVDANYDLWRERYEREQGLAELMGDDYEGACDGEASRREDHQRDE